MFGLIAHWGPWGFPPGGPGAKEKSGLSLGNPISPPSLPKKSLYLHLVSALLLETHSFLDQLFLYVCLSVSLPVTSAQGQGLTVSHGA